MRFSRHTVFKLHAVPPSLGNTFCPSTLPNSPHFLHTSHHHTRSSYTLSNSTRHHYMKLNGRYMVLCAQTVRLQPCYLQLPSVVHRVLYNINAYLFNDMCYYRLHLSDDAANGSPVSVFLCSICNCESVHQKQVDVLPSKNQALCCKLNLLIIIMPNPMHMTRK